MPSGIPSCCWKRKFIQLIDDDYIFFLIECVDGDIWAAAQRDQESIAMGQGDDISVEIIGSGLFPIG